MTHRIMEYYNTLRHKSQSANVIGVDILAPAIRSGWGALGYFVVGYEIMAQKAGQGYQAADCLIAPDLAGVSYLRLDYEKLTALGERAAEKKLPVILAALQGA